MSYQVVRVQGFSKGSLSGIGKEAERATGVKHRNEDIDPERAHLNITLKETQHGFYTEYNTIRAALNAQGKESKNAIAFEGMVITSDAAFFKGLGWKRGQPTPPEVLEFFQKCYEWAITQIGYQGTDKNILSAVIHMDETAPHLQLYYLPITDKWREKVYAKGEDGKVLRTAKGAPIQAKGDNGKSLWKSCENSAAPKHSKVEFWNERGAQQSYRRLQDSYHENIGARYGLERGEIGADREHTTKQQWQAKQLEKEVSGLRQEAKEARQTISKAEGLTADVKALEEQKAAIQTEIEPYVTYIKLKPKIAVDDIDSFVRSAKPTLMGNNVTVNKAKFEELAESAKAYMVHRDDIAEHHNLLRFAENDRKYYEKMKKEAESIKRAASDEYKRNSEPLNHLREAEMKQYALTRENQTLKSEVTTLRTENGSLRETVTKLQDMVNTLTERVRSAFEYLKCAVQAVGMLKYDKDDGYKVEGLTDRQGRLIDAIAEYGANRADSNGQPDYAEDMRKRIGISEGMTDEIKALEKPVPQKPPQSHAYER